MKPLLLDCTLRDGAYIVDSMFGDTVIRGVIRKLEDAGAEIIECGWLKNNKHVPDSTYYHVPSDLEPYLPCKKKIVTYAAMIDWDRYDLDLLPICDGKSLDAIRVVFPHGKHKEGIDAGRKIAGKGYQVYYQVANTMAYSDDELIELAEAVNSSPALSLSIVDTFGAMYEEDLDRVAAVLHSHLRMEIALGFHSHNNQQMSFALSQYFIRMFQETDRQVIVDASLCGMGRGAGNATTELMVSYLNRKCGCHYDIDAVMDAIDVYMEYFQKNYTWGYSIPFFISGLYCTHVNNIAYLQKNHGITAKTMRQVIDSMDPADRIKYDYGLLEKKYLSIMNRSVDDSKAVTYLFDAFQERELLLLAPGRSLITEQQRIKSFIEGTHPIVIGVNAMVSDYAYDYVFYANPARYDYTKNVMPDRFSNSKRIVLSNIKAEADEDEYIIAYAHATKRGWTHYDNSMICILRMLDWMGIEKVVIAGFDGFSHVYQESYADPDLPSLKTDGWDELNEEIRDLYSDFKRNARSCRKILFLTRSYFENKAEDEWDD